MKPIKVTDDIYMLSINVEDSALLFEEMWEIPKGVTLNSFIVKGEKTAIIDGVCGWDGIPENLFKLLDELQIKPEDIDYLIINHMEPDHSGWIEDFRKITDQFEIYCTAKAGDLLKAFFGQTERIHTVKTGDQLDLGNGRVLQFTAVPGVHWPDTMMTLETSTQTLFPCDMFGSFGQIKGSPFDDDMTEADFAYFYDEEIRYFANVLATFSKPVQKAIAVTKELNPKIIAPGHGPVYRTNPHRIIERYEEIVNYREGAPLKEVTLLWGSMYGMTGKAVQFVSELLEKEGIVCHNLKLPYVSVGEILSKVIRSAGVILAAPTYENKLFPAMAAALDEISRKRITAKKAVYFGSYGWSGGGLKEINEINERTKLDWQIIAAHEFNGSPTGPDLEKLEAAVRQLLTEM
ncbi:FprA family A-type flavoprotein [Clostridiales bacterium COT073_COT-073]|nr:FprA family A-type flavoprotein [Clostridiales bacterium COT073_COT-073]